MGEIFSKELQVEPIFKYFPIRRLQVLVQRKIEDIMNEMCENVLSRSVQQGNERVAAQPAKGLDQLTLARDESWLIQKIERENSDLVGYQYTVIRQ